MANSRRFLPRFRLRTFLLVLTVLCMYLASYLALVRPIYETQLVSSTSRISSSPHYRFVNGTGNGYRIAKFIFTPLHVIDRIARPNIWNPPIKYPSPSEWEEFKARRVRY